MDPTQQSIYPDLSALVDTAFGMMPSSSSAGTGYVAQSATTSSPWMGNAYAAQSSLFDATGGYAYAAQPMNTSSSMGNVYTAHSNGPFDAVSTGYTAQAPPPASNALGVSASKPATKRRTSRAGPRPSAVARRSRKGKARATATPGPSTPAGPSKSPPASPSPSLSAIPSAPKPASSSRRGAAAKPPGTKRTLIPLTDSMSDGERAQAKLENYRVRNSDSATKSRARKNMAVVEGALAAKGFASNCELLLELVGECEREMMRSGMGESWERVKRGVLERRGMSPDQEVKEVLFKRDESLLAFMADPEESKRELEDKVAKGELVKLGLAFSDVVARLVGREAREAGEKEKEELRERIAAAAKAREEGWREVEALKEKLNAKVNKVRKTEGEVASLRATAVRYGQEDYFSVYFSADHAPAAPAAQTASTAPTAPDALAFVPAAANTFAPVLADPGAPATADAFPPVAADTFAPALPPPSIAFDPGPPCPPDAQPLSGLGSPPDIDFTAMLESALPGTEFASEAPQADGWFFDGQQPSYAPTDATAYLQHPVDSGGSGEFDWLGDGAVDPQLLQLAGDQDMGLD